MNWISPFIVRIFSFHTLRSTLAAATAGAVLAVTYVSPATADPSLTATYQRQSFKFTHLSSMQGESTIGIGDPGFDALLRAVGASLTWQPGNRYVLISTPVPYDVGQISLQAAVAPYQQGNEVYLPLREVLSALDLVVRRDGDVTVLQPQLASLDVRTAGNRTDLVALAGAPLRPRILKQSADAIVYEFDGVGTSLTGTRDVGAGGIRAIDVAQQGTVRDPKTLVTVALTPGAVHDVPRSDDGRDVVLSFAGSLSAAQPAPAQNAGAESPQQAQAASASGASVTGVTVAPSDAGYVVTIAVTGDAAFEWHRLRDPDNRFWVDVKNAQLSGPPIGQSESEPVGALRVRQIDPSTVRIALSLTGPKTLSVSPAANGLTVEVGRDDVADAGAMVRSGSGSVGSVVA